MTVPTLTSKRQHYDLNSYSYTTSAPYDKCFDEINYSAVPLNVPRCVLFLLFFLLLSLLFSLFSHRFAFAFSRDTVAILVSSVRMRLFLPLAILFYLAQVKLVVVLLTACNEDDGVYSVICHLHRHTGVHGHTHTHGRIHTRTHERMHVHTRTRTHTHTRTRAHAHTRTRTHARTHTHAQHTRASKKGT